MLERLITPHLRKSKRSLLLLGPRQVGKTTLLAGLAPDRTLNLAHPATFREFVARPERLEQELAAAPEVRTVFLDEVQRVPALLDVVQVLHDREPDRWRFLLSGSSARKLRRGEANLLPGRIHVHHLHPLLAAEFGSSFDLEAVLAHGSLPGIVMETDPELRAADLRAYTDLYLREEIQAEAIVRDLGGYARLLDLVAAASGTILNLNRIAKEVGLAYETTRRYVQILEDTLLVFRLPAWRKSERGRLLSHPRLYLFDLGVRNALLRRPLDRPLDDERGLLLEHLVAYELHRRKGTLWPELDVHYFREQAGTEVDFVLTAGSETWAIEVKSSRNPTRAMAASLRRIGEYIPGVTRRILVHMGPRALKLDEVEALPLEAFLALLPT